MPRLLETNYPMPILQVIDVHKRYGSTVALDGIRFEVDQGELFGLLGPNGAGKTTLLSLLSCLLEADAGELRIQGTRVTLADRELRRRIGIVPQELAIYGELTARENLEFFGELYGIKGVHLRGRVKEVLSAVGLEDRANMRASRFSGGMKRRLNLGAAIVHDPALLLLDEPTTGVDPQSRNHIFEEVRRLNEAGVTIVYTTHYMEEVEALCKRVGIMDHGRLIACDSLPGLLQKLESSIRFRVPRVTALLRERIKQMPDVSLRELPDQVLEVECRDVTGVLPKLLAALSELHISLQSLETKEPNLERVFLHLTGRQLRD
ncbi:MAG TPA: ABC transporter ATP-binding protein [Gemmataceae bacterium]|nr:ABC transporter ATP-binding protein [Gemmataceae bacterium]